MNTNKSKNASLVGGILALLAGLVILFWGIKTIGNDDGNNQDEDKKITVSEDAAMSNNSQPNDQPSQDPVEPEFNYTQSAQLPDVTNGEVIQGITTNGAASGLAKAGFNDGKYMMIATFTGLPDPIDGAFYEGWLVNPDTTDFFSTGKVELGASGDYEDDYVSETDYTQSHTRYVLTLEPNDNDPAPADHIVEATMTTN